MLTDKQKAFCEEYLVDLNGTQAAIRAGYSERSARQVADSNMSKHDIQLYISELKAKRSERTEITADMVIAELAKIGFANTQDFVNGGNSILELKHIDRSKVAAVSGVKTTVKDDGSITSEVKFHDKVRALEMLGRHIGVFEKDNNQKQPIIKNIGFSGSE